jgi:glycosyltransferase involved in cell wall biosynthesis
VAQRFSVLLPTHNRADVAGFAIQSVLAQTFDDFELLIAGDGCTDDTEGVVRGFADPRIRWMALPKAPHLGYANRNVALREARGELIAYLAHDDLWLPDHLERLSAVLDADGSELAYSLLLVVSPDGIITPRIANIDDPRTMAQLMELKLGIGITCVIHRRDCLEKYGYWDDSMPRGADTELWRRYVKGGGFRSFSYLPVPTAFHFQAIWRTQSLKNRLRLKLNVLEGSLPSELSVRVPAGITEQQAVWQYLSGDLPGRTRQLRRAVQVELDRRASAAYPSALLRFMNEQYKKVRSTVTRG